MYVKGKTAASIGSGTIHNFQALTGGLGVYPLGEVGGGGGGVGRRNYCAIDWSVLISANLLAAYTYC